MNNSSNNNIVELRFLDCEINTILKALAEYNYNINKKYNFRKVSLTKEETTEKFLARNVYEHVLYCKSRQLQKAN